MRSSTFTLLFSFGFAIQPAAAFSVVEWVSNPPYANGGTIQEQIQCYALPFGAIGTISHLLTYFTVICLASGRSPIMPWRRLGNKRLNIAGAGLGLCISLPLAILTIVRCRNSWSFILIAVWKVMLSLTLSIMTIHAARLVESRSFRQRRPGIAMRAFTSGAKFRSAASVSLLHGEDISSEPDVEKGRDEEGFRIIYMWLGFYFVGSVIGLVGVLNLVKTYFPDPDMGQLHTVTYAFGGIMGGLTFLITLFASVGLCFQNKRALGSIAIEASFTAVIFALVFLTFLFAFFTDWVLAALDGDLVGVPSSDNAVFYWLYFAAKRLPMLSL